MFARHDADFTQFTAAAATPKAAEPALKGAIITVTRDTLLDTTQGWCAAQDLTPGMELRTLEGGTARLNWRSKSGTCKHAFLIPEGALNNCSDLILPEATFVGLNTPEGTALTEAPYIAAPLRAFEGLRGIRRLPTHRPATYDLGFEAEEMLWAQTGTLLHARPMAETFYDSLSFADTRALVALLDAGHFDRVA